MLVPGKIIDKDAEKAVFLTGYGRKEVENQNVFRTLIVVSIDNTWTVIQLPADQAKQAGNSTTKTDPIQSFQGDRKD